MFHKLVSLNMHIHSTIQVATLITQIFICQSQNTYYVSNNFRLNWNDAEQFCRIQCNSNLASIHSTIENSIVNNLINNSYQTETWIGLNNAQWSDNTLVDYSPGTTNVSLWNDNCVSISPQNNYKWTTHSCSVLYSFACNSCDGIVNKYTLCTQTLMQYSDVNVDCYNLYGTSLASIHSERDFQEALNLCQIYDNDCWIGLSDIEVENVFKWEDGTTFDYASDIRGGIYPWYENEPNNADGLHEDCAKISKAYNWTWSDGKCNDIFAIYLSYGLCNMPSELCDQSFWKIVRMDTIFLWFPINNPMKCELSMTGTGENILVMTGKQWINSVKLTIEYMFAIFDDDVNDGNSGILINFESICNYTYIGIRVSGNEYKIFIGRMLNGIYKELNSTIIFFTTDTYYLLSISITNSVDINIFLNDILYIQYEMIDIQQSVYSGYIGILNNNVGMNAKYLYVSGSKIFLNDIVTVSKFSNCSILSTTSSIPVTTQSIIVTSESVSTSLIPESTNSNVVSLFTTFSMKKFAKFKQANGNAFWNVMIPLMVVVIICFCALCTVIIYKIRKDKIEEEIHDNTGNKSGKIRIQSMSNIVPMVSSPSDKSSVVVVYENEENEHMSNEEVVNDEINIKIKNTDDYIRESVSKAGEASVNGTFTVHSASVFEFDSKCMDENENNYNVTPGNNEVELWLKDVVQLPVYYNNFVENGFEEIQTVRLITIDVLKEIGISKIGHRMKLMECIKQLNGN